MTSVVSIGQHVSDKCHLAIDTHHSELASQEHPSLAAQSPRVIYRLWSRLDHRQRTVDRVGP